MIVPAFPAAEAALRALKIRHLVAERRERAVTGVIYVLLGISHLLLGIHEEFFIAGSHLTTIDFRDTWRTAPARLRFLYIQALPHSLATQRHPIFAR